MDRKDDSYISPQALFVGYKCLHFWTKGTYSPIYPLDVDINEASSMLLYSGPISVSTFLKE